MFIPLPISQESPVGQSDDLSEGLIVVYDKFIDPQRARGDVLNDVEDEGPLLKVCLAVQALLEPQPLPTGGDVRFGGSRFQRLYTPFRTIPRSPRNQ